MSWDLILPFIAPLEPYLHRDDVTEIMVNADGSVWIEVMGQICAVSNLNLSEAKRRTAALNIARLLGDDISEEQPIVDSRLPDGSRFAAMMYPTSVGGTILTIRKFARNVYNTNDLIRMGMMTPQQNNMLGELIQLGKNIVISGGTGSGKSTLLNALAAHIPYQERVVLIEDTAELRLEQANLVRMEARRAQPDKPAVTMRDLLKASLRHRPDRIIVGEVRGAEAFDLLQAWNTGHKGSLTTLHANNAGMALTRLRTMISIADTRMPDTAIARSIAEVLDVVVQVERTDGYRHITDIRLVNSYDAGRDEFRFQGIAPYDPMPQAHGTINQAADGTIRW